MCYLLENEEIHTASRGGGDYDCSMMQFIENKELQEFFKVHPDYVLDGEIYSFGKRYNVFLEKLDGVKL